MNRIKAWVTGQSQILRQDSDYWATSYGLLQAQDFRTIRQSQERIEKGLQTLRTASQIMICLQAVLLSLACVMIYINCF